MKTFLRRFADSFCIVAGTRHFSQLGEDAVLAAHFRNSKGASSRWASFLGLDRFNKGYYVDIGAYSPKRGSNSYYFYKRGWHGVTVEPNRSAAKWFRFFRPRDTHVSAAITKIDSKVFYYSGGYSAVNFISNDDTPRPGFKRHEIQGLTLSSLFEHYVPKKMTVDFMSVDCEGHDLQVLRSNNWSLYRPSVVIAETHFHSEVTDFMVSQGYEVFSWTLASVMYKDVGTKA